MARPEPAWAEVEVVAQPEAVAAPAVQAAAVARPVTAGAAAVEPAPLEPR
ncbi:MAG TPA: hypothetical protein VMW05_11425 [Methyloceanibacter sp.]|nr:hypothetical protein [Methyloceanibacter sp.]